MLSLDFEQLGLISKMRSIFPPSSPLLNLKHGCLLLILLSLDSQNYFCFISRGVKLDVAVNVS